MFTRIMLVITSVIIICDYFKIGLGTFGVGQKLCDYLFVRNAIKTIKRQDVRLYLKQDSEAIVRFTLTPSITAIRKVEEYLNTTDWAYHIDIDNKSATFSLHYVEDSTLSNRK